MGSDLATLLLRDAEANSQAQAGSLAQGLRGVERIENAVDLAKARATVIETKDNPVVATRGGDRDASPAHALQGIDRVGQQVQQDLVELVFIDGYLGKIGFDLYPKVHIMLTNVIVMQRERFVDQPLQIG